MPPVSGLSIPRMLSSFKPLSLPRLISPQLRPALSRNPLSFSSCRCGCHNTSLCPCSCCIHPLPLSNPKPPTQKRPYTSKMPTSTYKLKDIQSLSSVGPQDKIESGVEGIEGGTVLVLRFKDQVHAMGAKCTHYGAPLKMGIVAPDGRITCPWHGG